MHWQHKLSALLRQTVMVMNCWSNCPWLQGWQRSSSSAGLLMPPPLPGHALSHLLWCCRLRLHLLQVSGNVCPVSCKWLGLHLSCLPYAVGNRNPGGRLVLCCLPLPPPPAVRPAVRPAVSTLCAKPTLTLLPWSVSTKFLLLAATSLRSDWNGIGFLWLQLEQSLSPVLRSGRSQRWLPGLVGSDLSNSLQQPLPHLQKQHRHPHSRTCLLLVTCHLSMMLQRLIGVQAAPTMVLTHKGLSVQLV